MPSSVLPGITRFSLVCLRFDDYHQDVDPDTWRRVLSEYRDRGLRGVVGVVPAYEDEPLASDVVGFLDDLVDDGWELAQHGYTHEDIGQGRGGLLYDERSEFAGVPLAEQRRRIGLGKDVLEDHGISPRTFIPPWHEYDRNTVRALSDHGFDCLHEGRWPLPRRIDGVTLVPTHPPGVVPATLAVGVVTLVGHPHLDSEPLRNARVVAGSEDRVHTASEIVDWWTDLRPVERFGSARRHST